MPNAASLNFPRFLLPAFPRWEPALLKRHRPVEDVTEQPAAARRRSASSRSSSSLSRSSQSDAEDPPARHTRILSHDSGCVVSDDDDEDRGGEALRDDGHSYTSASESASSSSDSLEIYLDTESGYGGSNEDILTMAGSTNTNNDNATAVASSPASSSSSSSSSSSAALQHQQTTTMQPHRSSQQKKHKRFPWSRTNQTPAETVPQTTLTTTTSYLHCSTCRTNICFTSAVISKGFTGRHGRAYLATSVVPSNIIHGKPTSRALQTGAHTVSDISCKICGSTLGWKYIHAEERSQRYKIGKYILETGRVGKINVWDGQVLDPDGERVKKRNNVDEEEKRDREEGTGREGWEPGWESPGDDDIEVDLADEEELEEMFSGHWNKDKVARRRERKRQMEEIRRRVDSNV
ncbi:hypothetical protein H072_8366 [Dactylellina haptotyla CBS 200.50]|uniref:Yippee domain-containing protein n=1 Tax=Dactylellina haptotyla (strain CBS 200.50) TaxID=1284197 RepID=S8A9V5_DACHA|nr:hypothetical protein H072_8366 [Dactylellina haptotyla CBS 200.50]